MSASKEVRGGIGLTGLVFVVLMTLKLAEIGPVAHWSWLWVTAPLWGVTAFIASVVLFGGLFVLLMALLLVVIAMLKDGIRSFRAWRWKRRH